MSKENLCSVVVQRFDCSTLGNRYQALISPLRNLPWVMLEQPFVWALVHVMVTASICFTLCGLAVGIGARLPMFGQTNTARIANGIGGTTNLLASLAMVSIMLTGVGYATWRVREANVDAPPDMISLAICASAAAFGIGTGLISLWVGGRHFNRVEV